jgi:2-polyprenyl-6-methoxyphenol hydroxylase-like FAD-dependent oxidoreductase
MAASDFRVVIVGAGIAGLTASHCLQKAGIDHVVLERRSEIDPSEGASFAVYPHGARILHQIGCLKAVEAACKPCSRFFSRGPDGRAMSDNGYFGHMKKYYDQDILLLERRRLLRLLYDGLPDKAYIRTGAQVKTVTQDANGVEVVLADGTIEKGDMVLGCDGVYSRVRHCIWDHASAMDPRGSTEDDKKSIQTHWKCLVGTGPPEPGLGERDMTSTSDNRYSFLTLTQPDRAFWFVFLKLDQPVVWPQRVSYTEHDAEELAQSLADHPVTESVVFGQLWKRRDRGVLIPIEEGVLKSWSSGRFVVAGDAAHKMTPNIGLGGNTAFESVTVLCNHLRRMLDARPGAKPTKKELEHCFQTYQDEHRARVVSIVQVSKLITRIQAWDSLLNRFLSVWLLPFLPDRALADMLSYFVQGSPKLEYLSADGFPRGQVLWHDRNAASAWTNPMLKLSMATTLVVAWIYFFYRASSV